MTFNAKNLSYHTHEPVFLQRLRHEHQGSSPGMNRTPVNDRRKHLKQSAEDDQPTYVMEGDGETVSKADFDQMVSQSDIETQNVGNAVNTGKEDVPGKRQALQGSPLTTPCDAIQSHTTTIGAKSRKRGIKAVNESAELSCDQNSEKKPQTPIKGKRSKKVKLSFEDID
ncbi:MAG: hypothetical protein OHK93_008677 [Ramalina farinacea]|uniref:DUF4604 domain-containing protein n=1 Tax=Ramalina farinacea TaxID=258253 RepID=A0AA43QPL4_9LECA|nr:hypothetical protein [Ramalina farinacea]